MDSVSALLSFVSVVIYLIFVFGSPQSHYPENYYLAGDAVVVLTLATLAYRSKGSALLPLAAIAWLAGDYLFGVVKGDCKWFASNGFSIATILSRVPLKNIL